jgi:hypothetical protein
MTSEDADLNLSYIYIQYTTDSNAGIKFYVDLHLS